MLKRKYSFNCIKNGTSCAFNKLNFCLNKTTYKVPFF